MSNDLLTCKIALIPSSSLFNEGSLHIWLWGMLMIFWHHLLKLLRMIIKSKWFSFMNWSGRCQVQYNQGGISSNCSIALLKQGFCSRTSLATRRPKMLFPPSPIIKFIQSSPSLLTVVAKEALNRSWSTGSDQDDSIHYDDSLLKEMHLEPDFDDNHQ